MVATDTPSSGDISLYAGLVRPDLTLKPWGRKFKTVAANLPELKNPAVKVPAMVFAEGGGSEASLLFT